MEFIDFFAGIGGFTVGLEQAGMKSIGFCERDKFAIKSYKEIHKLNDDNVSLGTGERTWFSDDITELKSSDIPYADGWTAGFPCQDVSISGHQKGLSGERSGLFYEVIRLLKGKATEDKPRWLCFENVKNLLSVNAGHDFTEILYQISEVGYDCEWQIINSKLYVPQNRERIFIIGHLRGTSGRKIFPIGGGSSQTCKKIIGKTQSERIYDANGLACTLTASGGGFGGRSGLYFFDMCTDPKITPFARCLMARYESGVCNRATNSGVLQVTDMEVDELPLPTIAVLEGTKKGYAEATVGDSINISFPTSTTRRGRVGKKLAQTLTTTCNVGTLMSCGRVRKLTPLECFRLQGFEDEMFYRAEKVNSNAQLYKQAGNGVTVPVIYEIGKKLMEVYDVKKQ